MNTKEIGIAGEKIAERYLKNKGYKILDKNYCLRIPGQPQKGEIDIITKKDGIVSFVEVKSLRGPSSLINPENKVNFAKRKRIIRTAEYWLAKNKIPLDSKWQIDVITITTNPPEKKVRIGHLKNIKCY